MSIRILLADDHQITRQGLRSLLEQELDMQVVGEAEEGRSAVELTNELKPDIVIMDISMPDLNGVEATHYIVNEHKGTKVIALSMHSDAQFVTEMLKSGASGYLLKDCAFDELTTAIRAVTSGKVYLSPAISRVVVEDYMHRLSQEGKSNIVAISDREKEVLQLVAEGKSTKEVALKLHISVKTVETHRRQIMNKLGLYSVAELTKYAIRKGLTSLE